LTDDFVSLTEAARSIGVSRNKMWKLVRAGVFTVYENPRDAREKLLKKADVDAYLAPREMRRSSEAAEESGRAA
jgi:hypothetical protein